MLVKHLLAHTPLRVLVEAHGPNDIREFRVRVKLGEFCNQTALHAGDLAA